jgi:uncharacterized membrane protein YdjX (TVP38/TMEM64 family)
MEARDQCGGPAAADESMKRYAAAVSALVVLLLALFVAVEVAQLPVLTDPRPALGAGGVGAALVGVGLLVADVVLPVPSSLVMLSHGALFGPVVGAALSLSGAVGAAIVGFAIGRGGGPLLHRLVSANERRRADALLERWGLLAVIVTRPVPVLAEAVAIMAGTSRMRMTTVALGAGVGALPAAVLYAVAGAVAASLANGMFVFGSVLAIGLVVAIVGTAVPRRLEARRR